MVRVRVADPVLQNKGALLRAKGKTEVDLLQWSENTHWKWLATKLTAWKTMSLYSSEEYNETQSLYSL